MGRREMGLGAAVVAALVLVMVVGSSTSKVPPLSDPGRQVQSGYRNAKALWDG